MPHDTTTVKKKIALIVGSIAVGAGLLSGCSSASAEGEAPEEMTVADASVIVSSYEQQQMEYQEKFSACLGKHGVSSSGDGALPPDPGDALVPADADDDAVSACTGEVGQEPAPTAEETTALRTWNGALTSCLTNKGHTMPDLQADGGWNKPAMAELLKTDSTLDSDTEACFTEISG